MSEDYPLEVPPTPVERLDDAAKRVALDIRYNENSIARKLRQILAMEEDNKVLNARLDEYVAAINTLSETP